MAPELEDNKGKKEEKIKMERRKTALSEPRGKKSVTPMHTPGSCQADRHDNNFLLS